MLKKNNTQQVEDTRKIVERFFEALDRLQIENRVASVAAFARTYGIHRQNLYYLKKHLHSRVFEPSWLTYLVRDYGVSANWLLTGIKD